MGTITSNGCVTRRTLLAQLYQKQVVNVLFRSVFWVTLALGVALGSGGCATVPNDVAERALYIDMYRTVLTKERVDWVVDRTELESLAPNLFRSACQVTPETRTSLLTWLDQEIEREGGSAKALYKKNGGDLGAVSDLLTLERVRSALQYAHKRAEKDCPFWIEYDPDFLGVQRDAGRFVLLLESTGEGTLVFRGDEFAVAAGGAGRVLPAWGVSENLTIGIGAELGGRGLLSTGGAGEQQNQELDALVSGGIPLLFRFHDLTRAYDVEVAAVAFTQFGVENSIQPGGRIAFAVGVPTVRVGAFLPIAMLQLTYDFYPATDTAPQTHLIRAGTRFVIDIDP